MKTPHQIVVERVHCTDAAMTVAQRIELYRAIAETTSSAFVAAHFFRCADELDAAEKKIGQRTLDFGREFGAQDGGAKS